jgi:pyruvate formate lyase activating enzyme
MNAKIVLRKTSFLDYPGGISTVFFFLGCNLRCPWCHNRELVLPGGGDEEAPVSLEEALAHAFKRRSVLKGVVLSGGEPTLWAGLPDLIRRVKKTGLPVKLDTNGMVPEMLDVLFREEETRPDYIALDLKLAPSRYDELLPENQRPPPGEAGKRLERSARLIAASGIAHEFRTLVFPRERFTALDIEALSPLADGAPWYIRPFMPGNCLDPVWNGFEAPGKEEALALAEKARSLGKNGLCP